MKQYWQKLATRIDALTLRERVIIFVLVAVLLIVLVNAVLLDPLFAKQKLLSDQVKNGQTQIDRIQTEIRLAILGQKDPDVVNRERLKELTQQTAQMQGRLLDMQKGLVAPDKMTVLLEDILKRHGSLHLLSLKTLPVTSLTQAATKNIAGTPQAVTAAAAITPPPGSESAAGMVYTHGVEIVVQGRYLEMLSYMNELENMPWHLYWGKATLKVDEYPQATLTLTLYTMSLNKKWLNL